MWCIGIICTFEHAEYISNELTPIEEGWLTTSFMKQNTWDNDEQYKTNVVYIYTGSHQKFCFKLKTHIWTSFCIKSLVWSYYIFKPGQPLNAYINFLFGHPIYIIWFMLNNLSTLIIRVRCYYCGCCHCGLVNFATIWWFENYLIMTHLKRLVFYYHARIFYACVLMHTQCLFKRLKWMVAVSG